MIWVYVGLAIFLAAAGGGVVWKYNSAIEKAERAEAMAAIEKETAQQWKAKSEDSEKEVARLNRVAKARELSRQAIEKERNNAHAEIEKLRQTDKPSADWLDQRLPRAIAGRLLEPNPGGAPPAAKSALDRVPSNTK